MQQQAYRRLEFGSRRLRGLTGRVAVMLRAAGNREDPAMRYTSSWDSPEGSSVADETRNGPPPQAASDDSDGVALDEAHATRVQRFPGLSSDHATFRYDFQALFYCVWP